MSPRNLIERLFHPERLNIILGKLADRRSEKATEIDRRVSALVAEISTAEDKLKRLYTMVENDPTDLDDILKDRIAALKSSRDGAKEALARIKLQPKPNSFNAEAIRRFGQIEVDDHAIRIVGDKATLEQVIAGDQAAGPDVRSFVRKWRAIQNKPTNSYIIEIPM